jgi:hypothetical protein
MLFHTAVFDPILVVSSDSDQLLDDLSRIGAAVQPSPRYLQPNDNCLLGYLGAVCSILIHHSYIERSCQDDYFLALHTLIVDVGRGRLI